MLKHRDGSSDDALATSPPRRFAVARRRAAATSGGLRGLPARDCATLLAAALLRAIPAIAGIEYGP